MSRKKLIQDFTEGNVTKQLLLFASPLFLSSLLQTVYNMADMVIVGQKLGKAGLSSVAVGGDVTNFLTFFAMGFSNAGQVIISQYIGAKEEDKVGRFICNMASFLMSLAAVMSILCLTFRRQILQLMQTPEEAFSGALSYSTICMAGLVFIYGYNMVSAILRGMGDSARPFIFISISASVNVVLDLLFVMKLELGAGGAALATVISQALSFFLCMAFIIRNRERYSITVRREEMLRLDKGMMGSMIALGFPMAIKGASVQFSKLFVNSWINSYGVTVSAFAGVANKINLTTNLVSNSFNT
ncbi:MAG: polysaccharide biosynthesis C-terminal domain-containing protein, partial [Blautia sp.]|nr:polysaccharide biosynthesis C-terminal domain-containing protein [Blautia sp.]